MPALIILDHTEQPQPFSCNATRVIKVHTHEAMHQLITDLLQKASVVRGPVAGGLGSIAKIIAARIKQHHLCQPTHALRIAGPAPSAAASKG